MVDHALIIDSELRVIAAHPHHRTGELIGRPLTDVVTERYRPLTLQAATTALTERRNVTAEGMSKDLQVMLRGTFIPTGAVDVPLIVLGQRLPRGWSKLTPRERDVISAYKDAVDVGQVCDRLGISRHTLNAHRRSIIAKMDIAGAFEFHRFCQRFGAVLAFFGLW